MNSKPRYQDFVNEQMLAKVHGVFIDDTGSPGLRNTPNNLHPDRKTWVAVVIPKTQIAEVWQQFPGALKSLNSLFGAHEFHFTDIYMGRKEFKGIPFERRLALIEFMSSIFKRYKFPVFVQTFDPKSFAKIRGRSELPDTLGAFNLRSYEDFALLFLLMRVKWHLEESYEASDRVARVFVDEGYKKNGVGLCFPPLSHVFADGLICFAKSDTILPLQLADFAAFCLNRTQLVTGKHELTHRDIELLRILSPIAWNYRNIPKITARDWFNLDEDRPVH